MTDQTPASELRAAATKLLQAAEYPEERRDAYSEPQITDGGKRIATVLLQAADALTGAESDGPVLRLARQILGTQET